MLHAKDLMIGDYLLINRDGLCIKKGAVVEVRGIDADDKLIEAGLIGSTHCRPLDKELFDGGIWCDYLDPIPLTPEILEKNFPNTDSGLGWFPDGDGFHCDSSYSEGDILVSGFFRYVHELQHCLRLCEIDKEITL